MLMRCSLTSLVVLGACASEGGAFRPGDDPGGGTGTLTVTATARATPRYANAAAAADFDTTFQVVLEEAGVRLTTGTVTVASVEGEVALRFDTRDGGSWIGDQAGYHEIYVLDAASGAGAIDGVRVDGPDLHVFTAPAPATTVDGTLALAVAWTRVDTADTARLRTLGGGATAIPDSGSFTIEPGGLASAPDRPTDEELTLDRSHAVAPAGGATGSTWTVEVRNQVKIVVAPTAPPPGP